MTDPIRCEYCMTQYVPDVKPGVALVCPSCGAPSGNIKRLHTWRFAPYGRLEMEPGIVAYTSTTANTNDVLFFIDPND